jgi:2-polyprenyl-3-methyl-5-hydroxy-6-metoxy-1,4-benzoquinol methylase
VILRSQWALGRGKVLSSIYEVPVDPSAENNAHAFALSMIGFNKSVLEVGCASGYLTKLLVERGCDVVGMEIDPDAADVAEKWADRVVVGDVDDEDIWNYIKDESFDVLLLGDVLEHLRRPLAALRHAVRKLKPTGFVVTSMPNVAHGDVRIALMNGRFQYSEWGLLDRTHLRFFTLETIREFLSEAGLVVVDTKRVVEPLFHTELGVTRRDISPKTLDELYTDPEIETYQFVMKSVRENGSQAVAELATRVNELSDRVYHQRVRLALFRKTLRDTTVLDQHIAAHQEYIKALEGHVSGLEHNIEVLTEGLVDADARYRAAMSSRTVSGLLRRVYGKLRVKKN